MHPHDTPSDAATDEVWLPYPPLPYLLEVSSFGRVRRIVPVRDRGRGKTTPFVYKPRVNNKGYYRVTISLGDRAPQTEQYIHIMVALAFIGPCPPGHEVDHKDTNPKNNRADNLQYVTHGNNLALIHVRRGTPRPGLAKLTMEQVVWARAQRAAGTLGTKRIAQALGMTTAPTLRMLQGKTYRYDVQPID